MEQLLSTLVYPAIITALLGFVGYMFKKFADNLFTKMERLLSQIEELNKNVVKQNERQNAFEDRLDAMDQRYNMVISDLKEVAREHRKCKNFDVRP